MKRLSEMTSKGHSRSSAMQSFVSSSGRYIRDCKNRLHLLSDRNSWNNLEGRSQLWWYNSTDLASYHFLL